MGEECKINMAGTTPTLQRAAHGNSLGATLPR